jgi:hypothetical protein
MSSCSGPALTAVSLAAVLDTPGIIDQANHHPTRTW